MQENYHCWLGGKPFETGKWLAVERKDTGEVFARAALANADHVEQALALAQKAETAMARLPAWRRREILNAVADELAGRCEEIARVLALESGKPIANARGEVDRAVDTFRIAAEESVRLHGEEMALDSLPIHEGTRALSRRFPLGTCGFITPFNFPLNLVAHKVAPAIAAGCPFVLKPASSTPLSALILGDILSRRDLPQGSFSILPCPGSSASALATDERVALLSFTGSPEVGWALKKSAAVRARVVLELGGDAACIVDEGSRVDAAAERIVFGAFYQAGQSCISVQRIMIHESLYDEVLARVLERTAALTEGALLDDATFIGPLISEEDARRVEAWIAEAVEGGATLLCGGKRDGRHVSPALLEEVPPTCNLATREVFGPVAVVERFSDFGAAIEAVNRSAYGLQVGVFTPSLDHAFFAFEHCEVGGVVIGDVPSFRSDAMPYGGVKMSGLGREGVRTAIEEMSEPRLMVLRGVGRS